jgi:calcium-translocating P-type ATPase
LILSVVASVTYLVGEANETRLKRVKQGIRRNTMTAKDDINGDAERKEGAQADTEAPNVSGHLGGMANTNGVSIRSDTRFGGLAGAVEASVNSSVDKHLGNITGPYCVTAVELGNLSTERTRLALAEVLERGILGSGDDSKPGTSAHAADYDVESPSDTNKLKQDVLKLVASMRTQEEGSTQVQEYSAEAMEADKNADMAANVLTSVLLRSSPETGIDPREVEHRRDIFGSNAIADKETDSFLFLCFEAVQDFVLIMLIVLGVISIVVEVTTIDADEDCKTCWIEGAAILCSVMIVVFVTAGIDYVKQFQYIRLTRSLYETNIKAVIRDGKQVAVTDHDIVVGDILSVNSHSLASIPADCIVLGPATDLKVDESTLTGESKFISKKPGDIVLSGTSAVQGSGKMVVIAVGINSVAGKIKARVYDSDDLEDGLDGDDDNSPLFVKLDSIAKRIGVAGTVAALIAFIGSCVIGLGIEGDSADHIIDYLVTAITVLAVAVPEGLPLAVTLALAFSSNKMMKESNLVKHLDACETMGCATTICTDKTGMLRHVLLISMNTTLTSELSSLTLAPFLSFRNTHGQQDDNTCSFCG